MNSLILREEWRWRWRIFQFFMKDEDEDEEFIRFCTALVLLGIRLQIFRFLSNIPVVTGWFRTTNFQLFQVYPGRFHHFFEHSTCTYLLYVMVHLFFHASFIGGLLSVIKSSSARPLEAVASFADVHTFAYNYGFYAVERSAGIEAICWACGGTLVVFFV